MDETGLLLSISRGDLIFTVKWSGVGYVTIKHNTAGELKIIRKLLQTNESTITPLIKTKNICDAVIKT